MHTIHPYLLRRTIKVACVGRGAGDFAADDTAGFAGTGPLGGAAATARAMAKVAGTNTHVQRRMFNMISSATRSLRCRVTFQLAVATCEEPAGRDRWVCLASQPIGSKLDRHWVPSPFCGDDSNA